MKPTAQTKSLQNFNLTHNYFPTALLIAAAIVAVVDVARSKGQSLEDLLTEVLADDALLDSKQRHWLSEIIAIAWENLT